MKMRNFISELRESAQDLLTALKNERCLENKSHAYNSKTSFVCVHPGCKKRMICQRCMIEDVDHVNNHQQFIKTIQEFESVCLDRCIDVFASEMDLVSDEVSNKFKKKVNKCAKDCTKTIIDKLKTGFPEKVEDVELTYDNFVEKPVRDISASVRNKIEELGAQFLVKPKKKSLDYREEMKRSLNELILFVSKKAEEEQNLWDSAGKILQRQKHRVLYNKELEANLKRDVEKLTEEYMSKVMATYKSYFFPGTEEVSEFEINEGDQQFIEEDSDFLAELSSQIKEPHQHQDNIDTTRKKQQTTLKLLKKNESSFKKTVVQKQQIIKIQISKDETRAETKETRRRNQQVSEFQDDNIKIEEDFNLQIRKIEDIQFAPDTLSCSFQMRKVGDFEKTREDIEKHLDSNDAFQEENESKASDISSFKLNAPIRTRRKTIDPDLFKQTVYTIMEKSEKLNTSNMTTPYPVKQQDNAFYTWLPNDESKFCKMFLEDFRFFSVSDILIPEDISSFMQAFYELYYSKLFYVFLEYQSSSMTYPGLSWMVMNNLMASCGFIDNEFTESTCDMIFHDVTDSVAFILQQDQKTRVVNRDYVLRADFMSYLARASVIKYFLNDECEHPVLALKKFMNLFLKTPKNCYEEYETKRIHELHTSAVDKTVQFFLDQAKEVFDEYVKSDGYLKLEDLMEWIDTTEIIMNESEIQRCFCLSRMPNITENQIGVKDYRSMEFVEFLEFLVRISEIDFYHDSSMDLPNKVQKTFQKLFYLF